MLLLNDIMCNKYSAKLYLSNKFDFFKCRFGSIFVLNIIVHYYLDKEYILFFENHTFSGRSITALSAIYVELARELASIISTV